MERHQKAISGGLRAWLLILPTRNVLFAVLSLYSGIRQVVQMGLGEFALQVATGNICLLNIVFICYVLRQRKWSVYVLVAGLVSVSVTFAASWWVSAEPSEGGEAIFISAALLAVGLAITVVLVMVLRPIMRQPSYQIKLPTEPSTPTSNSQHTHNMY